jgi:DNA-binding MarR family transcriptional regulator
MLLRRLRQERVATGLTMPESAALNRLDRLGDSAAADLARREQISPQSMGATLAALEERGLVLRRPDPEDGRRVLLTISEAGRAALQDKRSARADQLAAAIGDAFTEDELRTLAAAAPLLERLAERVRGSEG